MVQRQKAEKWMSLDRAPSSPRCMIEGRGNIPEYPGEGLQQNQES